jgi:hypothetical protein
MRVKILFVGATLAGALLMAAAVQAATPQQLFTGELDSQPDAAVRLKTGANNGFAVRLFGVHDFSVDCGANDGTIKRATIKGRIAVGAIDGRKASGVFRFSGEIEDQDGQTQTCDSGRLDWSAKATQAT